MPILKQLPFYFATVCSSLALFLCSGCANSPVGAYANLVEYEPVRSPVEINASASIEVVDTLSPDTQKALRNYLGHSDAIIASYLGSVEQTIRNDLATSGLFARITNSNGTKADYQVKARCEELHPSDYRVRITLTATETATNRQISSHIRENSVATSIFGYHLRDTLPGLMAALKADLVADLTERTRRLEEEAARKNAKELNKASLTDLLASSDKTELLARERNRAIIAAKNQQLPAILREKKTEELSELVVKTEQTILDLNHECEVAKDKAQQSVADDGNPRGTAALNRGRGQPDATAQVQALDELRGLAICYRERIELLKPILAALKDEIANRSR